jgi:L-asparaginase / beta-aspartyl-peptidase
MKKFALAIHGGAGTLLKSQTNSEKELAYTKALNHSLTEGQRILQKGGSAIEAVEAAVISMEDCEYFNAGKGAVFTNKEKHELEASIMCGRTGDAGAVAAISKVKNPVVLCRTILSDHRFVYLMGRGAEEYAVEKGLEIVNSKYFNTDYRREQLYEVIAGGGEAVLDHDGEKKYGTVGAVALDMYGDLAAATSTGGLTNKKYGRIGDSSLIGAGCFADNDTCAISATGYGEYFIRKVTAHEISAIVKYKGLSLQEAADIVVFDQLKPIGGEGGIIGVDKRGNIVFSFNSDGMYRGWTDSESNEMHTAIYKD